MTDIGFWLKLLDYFGIAVFAASGALMAARQGQTLVTFAFFALVTGVGGGSVRDLLIGAPVFWVQDGLVSLLCIGIALLVWIAPEKWWQDNLLEWFDAVGLAAYSVFGTAKALTFGVPPFPAILMGVITACVGGIIRDVLASQPSIIMRPELYVTAAFASAAAFALLLMLGLVPFVAALIAAPLGFALRASAIHWQIALPSYHSKSGPE
ncbi:trimeric intracellular cation channel family protein [Sphingorhabdus arenilitoris]|uniref:Trimeric intracellular cation channel family protein n=1 Tax=Sphingorhabdus arenilitoris TaxID=1490041 RepID=A0ABV8RF17_9SPHN